jgi:hypothetical protein
MLLYILRENNSEEHLQKITKKLFVHQWFKNKSPEVANNHRKEDVSMKSWKVLMETLKNRWFPTEEDNGWKLWVDLKNREVKDLIDLLSSKVKDSYKRRALFLLIAPAADFNPIYWKNSVGNFYHGTEFLEKLSPELLNYSADLIAQFSTILKPQHNYRPRCISEGGGGLTMYMHIPDKYHGALRFYNNCIFTLLILLPLEQGEKIFPLFSLNDISTFWNMDDASGYNPFRNLLYNEEINERWKKIADMAMHKIILDEIEQKRKPREDWENALSSYADIIQMQLYSKLKCSVELFAEQMQFIIDHREKDIGLINGWNIIKIFNVLSDSRYKELRHQISRFVVLEDNKLSIYDDKTRQAADQMLADFSDDIELVEKIKILIEEEKKNKARDIEILSKKQELENDILAQMS